MKKKRGKKVDIDNLKVAMNLGALNINFNWVDIQGKSNDEVERLFN